MSHMIQTNSLCFKYPRSEFKINDINIKLQKGELVAVHGKNGSGKTTVGKIIAGLLKPDSGEVMIDGENTKEMTLAQVGSKVGYLFQEPSTQLFAPIVKEDLTFVLNILGADKEQTSKKADDLLKKMELYHLKDRSILYLSRGEKQRLAICGLLMNNPDYMVLDEPTTGLDKERKNILSSVISGLKDSGIGILLIGHDKEFMTEHADREIRMSGGEIVE